MHDTILAGRIAAFLSGAFPLGERSGSNQEGRFNVDNRTLVEEADDIEPEDKAAEEGKEETEGTDAEAAGNGGVKAEIIDVDTLKPEKSKGSEAQPAETPTLQQRATPDSRFYALFWSAQQFFANPTLLFEEESVLPAELLQDLEDPASRPEDSGALREFRIATKRIVDLMSAVNEHELSLAGAEQGHSAGASGDGDTNEMQIEETEAETAEKESFFPKYLTGRNILASEVRDPSFRRQVLVQFLILLQYILEFNPKRRPMWENSKNKALLRPYILSEADVSLWLGKRH
jgi:THO complex subunit 1